MKWYKNTKISQKLIIGFLIIAIISAVVGSIGVINIFNMKDSDSKLYEENTLGLKISGEAAVMFQQLRYNILKLVNTEIEETDSIQETADYINELVVIMNDDLTACHETINDANANEVLTLIQTDWDAFSPVTLDIIKNFETGNPGMASARIPYMTDLGSSLRDHFLELFSIVSANAESRADKNASQAQTAVIIMLIVIAGGLACSIILGIYISRLIGHPLNLMAEAADKLALGDVDVDVYVDTNDEIGRLALAFGKVVQSTKEQVQATQKIAEGDLTTEVTIRSENDMLGKGLSDLVTNLNQLVVTIVTTAEQVASGSNMVSDSSISLSQGATEQASSVQELTASLEEISSQTNLNAKNAQKANELAVNAKLQATNGNVQMHEMLKAMEDINVSSSSINKIIKVIDDIAFQTNILALNAAVEAARAGQHGRGFAVVAEEVRNLAARSANAAKETTLMIEGSIKKVEAGTKIANETADALGQIVDQVEKAADLVSAIATASKEQAAGIDQVNLGVMQVSQVVQTTAATSEESAAASEELSSQAAQLKEAVNVFKLKDMTSQTGKDDRMKSKKNKESVAKGPTEKKAKKNNEPKKNSKPKKITEPNALNGTKKTSVPKKKKSQAPEPEKTEKNETDQSTNLEPDQIVSERMGESSIPSKIPNRTAKKEIILDDMEFGKY